MGCIVGELLGPVGRGVGAHVEVLSVPELDANMFVVDTNRFNVQHSSCEKLVAPENMLSKLRAFSTSQFVKSMSNAAAP